MPDPFNDYVVVPEQHVPGDVVPEQVVPAQTMRQGGFYNRPSFMKIMLGILFGFLILSFFTSNKQFAGRAEQQPFPGYGTAKHNTPLAKDTDDFGVSGKPDKLDAFANDKFPDSKPADVEIREARGAWSKPLALTVAQGEVLKVQIRVHNSESEPVRAYLGGQVARFFSQDDNEQYLALVPTSVFQKAGNYPLKVEDTSGKMRPFGSVTISDAHYKTQNMTVGAKTAGLQPLPGEMEAIQSLKTVLTPIRFWQEPFTSPTPDCQNSPFGVKRYHNGQPTGDYHKGVDLRSPQGRPILATAAGVVKIARMYRLHGGTVGIDHGQGVSSIYIHMSKIKAQVGEHVLKGDIVGYVGSTGFATGPHLHWGMYVSGLPVNPNQWITPVVSRCP